MEGDAIAWRVEAVATPTKIEYQNICCCCRCGEDDGVHRWQSGDAFSPSAKRRLVELFL